MKVASEFNGISLILEGNKKDKLAPNFLLEELANNAGDPAKAQYLITPESLTFLGILQTFRDIIGQPITVNSGYRQPDYNRKIGGDSRSAHTHACAVDIAPPGKNKNILPVYIIDAWFAACARYKNIGAVNIYKDHTYYHLEAFSDLWYGVKAPQIRVYSNDAEYANYKRVFASYGYEVKRC